MELKIGPTLRLLMKQRGLTLKSLSKATGVSASTLGEWTQNRSPKNPLQARAVASHLGVSMHYLLFGEADANEEVPIESLLKKDVFNGTFEISVKRIKFKKNQE